MQERKAGTWIEEQERKARIVLQAVGVAPNARIVGAMLQFAREYHDELEYRRGAWGHPSIAIVKGIANVRIPAGLIGRVLDIVGTSPDVGLLQRCYDEWHARGKPPQGWGWLLEWYPAGGPPERATKDGPRPSSLQDLGLA